MVAIYTGEGRGDGGCSSSMGMLRCAAAPQLKPGHVCRQLCTMQRGGLGAALLTSSRRVAWSASSLSSLRLTCRRGASQAGRRKGAGWQTGRECSQWAGRDYVNCATAIRCEHSCGGLGGDGGGNSSMQLLSSVACSQWLTMVRNRDSKRIPLCNLAIAPQRRRLCHPWVLLTSLNPSLMRVSVAESPPANANARETIGPTKPRAVAARYGAGPTGAAGML